MDSENIGKSNVSENVIETDPKKDSNKSKKPNNETSVQIEPNPKMIPFSSQEMILRIQNSINGQLAILFKESDKEVVAVPINFFNKKGKVVLGIDRPKHQSMIWGLRFGQWVRTTREQHMNPEYPLGLGVLVPINKLFVSEQITSKNEISMERLSKRYMIRNGTGELLFVGKHKVNFKFSHYFGKSRQIDIKLYDAFKREVVFCRKLMRFNSCPVLCLNQCMEVMGQPSKSIGCVRLKSGLFGSEYLIEDRNQRNIFVIKTSGKGVDNSLMFEVLSMTEKSVGKIESSLNKDTISGRKEMPVLSLEFKENINPIEKTLLISAMFLIKYLTYDSIEGILKTKIQF